MSETRQGAVASDGTLVYTSVSAAKKFQACPAAWWFRYVARRPEPQGPGAKLGEQCHSDVEHYLTTGSNVMGEIPRAALEAGLLPAPKTPGMLVEQSFGENGFRLESDGVPFKGFIDLVLPPERGVVRVRDWKFKCDIKKYGTTPAALLDPNDEDGLQMVGYAVALANAVKAGLYPEAERVQVEHAHIQTKKADGRYPTALISAEPIQFESAENLWQGVASTLRAMKDVARAGSAEQVEGNKRACFKYGGCPHQQVCPHFKSSKPDDRSFRLAALFTTKEIPMGMLSKMKNGGTPAPPASPPAPEKHPLITDESTVPDAELKAARATASVLPPDAPTPVKPPAPSTEPTQAKAVEVAAFEEPKKPRAKKAKSAPEEASVLKVGEDLVAKSEAVRDRLVAEEWERARLGSFSLYIGCAPRKTTAASLTPYVDALEQKALAGFKEQGLAKDVDDIRLVSDSVIGYGKWKAVLAALAKNAPPAAGAYTVLAFPSGDERVDAVVAALEGLAQDVVAR